MHLSCNTPAYLWDEFFATASYLTNLTAASANNGRTPYQLWYNRKPSLSHLHEIGCQAFSLQQPSQSIATAYVIDTPADVRIYHN